MAAAIASSLTSGGHNAGIVCEPGHAHRHYRLSTRPAQAGAPTPAAWQADAEQHDGSWWQAWGDWLGAHSSGPQAPPPMGAAPQGYGVLCDAPGTYIMER